MNMRVVLMLVLVVLFSIALMIRVLMRMRMMRVVSMIMGMTMRMFVENCMGVIRRIFWGNYMHPHRSDAASVNLFDFYLSIDFECGYGPAKELGIDSGLEQSAQHHVSTYAGETI